VDSLLILIIFAGLPGVGKSTIARELARQSGAVFLRIDSIEQALCSSGLVLQIEDSGYCVAYAMAEDHLRQGRSVIADCVNPLALTRDSWLDVAKRCGVRAFEIEVQCSDPIEHRRRIETRTADIPGLILPTWDEVVSREYHPWTREPLVLDTATRSVEENVAQILQALKDRQKV
jgi:predicted kinase